MSDLDAAVDYIRQHPERTLGPWLVGGLIELFLMGALVAMVSEYWERYGESDSWKIKAVVWTSVLLNVLRTLQTIAALWHKLIADFGDYVLSATSSPWYSQLDPLTTVLTCLLVQAFLAARLNRLTGGLRWLLVLLIPVMALALGGHIVVTVQIHFMGSVSAIAQFNRSMSVALCGLMASDVIITASISYFLWKSKTGIRRTDSLIWRLLHVTWITATLPCISELLNLVVYLAELGTGNSTFIIFHLMGPKLYSLSMMYTLNARQALRSRDNSIPLSTVDVPTAARIEVNREVLRFEDGPRRSVKFGGSTDHGATDVASRGRRGSVDTDTMKAPPVA